MVSDPANGGNSQSPSVFGMKGRTQAFNWCWTAWSRSRPAALINAHRAAAPFSNESTDLGPAFSQTRYRCSPRGLLGPSLSEAAGPSQTRLADKEG